MAHFPQDDTTRLERPRVIIYRQEQPAWVIEARQGVIDNQEQVLSLLKEVQLSQGQREDKGAMHLKTEVLHISLAEEVATTEERVYAVQEGVGHAEGTGMTLDLKKDRLELHAQVQFTYENP
jgi:lipopolysaccharide export system protein LptC